MSTQMTPFDGMQLPAGLMSQDLLNLNKNITGGLGSSIKKYTTVDKIDGSVTGRARDKAINAFQEHEHPRIIVAQPRTTGHGLELSAADTVIWYGPIFSNNIYEQACHRVMSGMQKNSIGVYHLGSTPLEWRIFKSLKDGVDVQQNMLALYDAEMKGTPA